MCSLIMVTLSASPYKFITPLKDVTVLEGTKAVLQCEVNKPEPPVTWYKAGKPLKPGEDYEMIEEGTIRKLIIKNAKMSDMDKYQCELDDLNKTQCKLTVKGKLLIILS